MRVAAREFVGARSQVIVARGHGGRAREQIAFTTGTLGYNAHIVSSR